MLAETLGSSDGRAAPPLQDMLSSAEHRQSEATSNAAH